MKLTFSNQINSLFTSIHHGIPSIILWILEEEDPLKLEHVHTVRMRPTSVIPPSTLFATDNLLQTHSSTSPIHPHFVNIHMFYFYTLEYTMHPLFTNIAFHEELSACPAFSPPSTSTIYLTTFASSLPSPYHEQSWKKNVNDLLDIPPTIYYI